MPIISPTRLGLPQFAQWRSQQPSAITELIDALTPMDLGGGGYDYAVLPDQAGFGKSGVYLGMSQLMRRTEDITRTIIMTASRGLQDQVGRDAPFSEDIKGRANYKCTYDGSRKRNLTCKDGPEHGCEIEDSCAYTARKRICSTHHTVITNYACRLSMSMYPNATGVGEFDLNIADEAHLIPDEITRAMAVELNGDEQSRILNDIDSTMSRGKFKTTLWNSLAAGWLSWYTATYIEEDPYGGRSHDSADEETRALRDKVASISKYSGTDNWLTYHKERDETLYLDVIWPGMYARNGLYPRGKTLFVTATATNKLLGQIGVPGDKVYWRHTGGQFDPRRWPAYWLKTCQVKGSLYPKPNQKEMPRHAKSKLISTIDHVIRTRAVDASRNGVIIPPSYELAKWIKENSTYGNRIIVPTAQTTRADVERFKSKPSSGIVLCSPAIGTGYDFPNDTGRWLVIPKVPYSYHGDPLIKARNDKDPRYSDGLVAQELAQMVSRLMRGPLDWCEIFILDDLIYPFLNRNRDIMVDWFPLWDERGNMRIVDWLPKLMEVPSQ